MTALALLSIRAGWFVISSEPTPRNPHELSSHATSCPSRSTGNTLNTPCARCSCCPRITWKASSRSPQGLGFSGGDCRRWTHEVRIPERVFIRTGHLQAVLAARSLVGASRPVEDLFNWCANEGADTIAFDHPSGDDFEELRRQCLEYIRKQIY